MAVHNETEGNLLVLAPLAGDALAASQVLGTANLAAVTCTDLTDLATNIRDSTDAVLITEEALTADQLPSLLEALSRQPSWSDVPVILLTSRGQAAWPTQRTRQIFGPSANVSFLERPFHAATLLAAVHAAMRARNKQRQVRDL